MSTVRILGGALRGRALRVPEGLRVRPMRGRIRQSLFDHLAELVPGSHFLDIFAGCGAIGLEAFSRGAARVRFVERDPAVLKVLRTNIERCGATPRTHVLACDVYTAFGGDSARDNPATIVFLDPPFANYEQPELDPWGLAFRIAAGCGRGAVVGLEAPASTRIPESPPGLELRLDRAYGNTRLVLWEIEGAAERAAQ